MKIVKLTTSNVKRLYAVEITPDGSVVCITGKNGAGKSSVLDSIEYALAGKSSQCPEPVRKGAKSAEVVCDLGEFKVRRTFTKGGGGSLSVESNGEIQLSPQTVLDRLVGNLTFDPLKFSRCKPTEQADTLRQLVDLDLAPLDIKRANLFANRTNASRDLKAAKARFDGAPGPHEGAGDVEESSAAVVEEMQAAQAGNDENADGRHAADTAANIAQVKADTVASLESDIFEAQQRIERLNTHLSGAAHEHKKAKAEADELATAAAKLEDADIGVFRTRLAELEGNNRKVRENADRKGLGVEVNNLDSKVRALTRGIDGIDEDKAAKLAAIEFPVEGLGFDDDGRVTLGGLPFEQASQAEQLRVSVAIGLAANPKLRVLLIRDGSLLDEDGMKVVSEMAAKADAQLWIERVEDDQPGAIVIEDGSVVCATP